MSDDQKGTFAQRSKVNDQRSTLEQQSSKLHRRKLIFLLALLVAGLILSFFFIRNLIDFPVYYAAGRSLVSGRVDLYSPDFALGQVMDYRYPPFFLLALAPLWLLPYHTASYVWTLFEFIGIVGCIVIIRRTFQASRAMWIAVAFAAAQYFAMALHYGNAQLIVVFLVFASLYLLLRRRDIISALLLALAITIKLTPILLLPYFAVKKRWKIVWGVLVFLILFNIAPSAYFGFRENNQLLETWYNHVVASQQFHEENGPINLSLKGELTRYLSDVDYSARIDGDVNYPAVNVASLSRDRVVDAWAALAGLLFIGVLLVIWRRTPNEAGSFRASGHQAVSHDDLTRLELSIMICLMLFVSPLTSKIYFTAALWPLACMAEVASQGTDRQRKLSRYGLMIVAAANCVLPLLPGRSIQRLLAVLGADFYLNCLMIVCLLYSLISRDRLFQTQSGESQTPARSEARTP
jgi:hypothetical protein